MLQHYPMYAYVPAKDVARARQFYEQTLGFAPGEEIAGGIAYEFADGTSCFLYPTANAGTSQASQAFWQVDDVEREVAELKARGVAFEDYDMPGEKSPSGVITAGGAKAAWFKDTEGNILAIIEDVREPGRLTDRMRTLVAKAPASLARLRPRAASAAALAVGAFAVGALAFGVLAIGRLAIGHARIRRLDIDELRIRNVLGSLRQGSLSR